MIEDQINSDLKEALLSKNSQKSLTLRQLKSALLYKKVELNKRDSGLTREEEMAVLAHEAKKRQESADLYLQGNNEQKANDELQEKAIIDHYLPKALTDQELGDIIDQVIQSLGQDTDSKALLGQVIKEVKIKVGVQADGSKIAQLTALRLNK